MGKPVWTTPAGSLGVIPQGTFYEVPITAYDPEKNETVFFEVISGNLPKGVSCNNKGIIAGIPNINITEYNVESRFAVRAYTQRNINGFKFIDHLADRTFTLTVTGQQPPEFITPSGLVGQFYDGAIVRDPGVQIEFTDYENSTIALISGELPAELTISEKGLITGYVDPHNDRITTYTFTLEVRNNAGGSLRSFSVDVYNRDTLTADNTYITADNDFITADVSNYTPPVMVTPTGSIGTVPGDTFFAFQFQAVDFNDQQLGYEPWNPDELQADIDPIELGNGGILVKNTIPPGLLLEPWSGWLMGYLPKSERSFETYEFQIYAYELENPEYNTGPITYSLTLTGEISSQVEWLTPQYLGCINNGEVSTFYVKAFRLGPGILGFGSVYDVVGFDDETYDNLPLQYKLKEGSYSLLPQGLQLLPSGDISGRASFNTFAIDGGTTTFDIEPHINEVVGTCGPCDCITCDNCCEGCASCGTCPGIECSETTFDMLFRFVVNVYSPDGEVDLDRECSILLKRCYNEPYENLYIEAMPPINDRWQIEELLTDSKIFPKKLIYRPTDPFFGVAKDVIYWHAFGLTSSTRETYLNSMEFNHYWKQLTLGEIKTARALDSNGDVLYEVVYSQVIDTMVNNEGITVDRAVTLPYPIPIEGFDRRADSTMVTVDNYFVTADVAPFTDPSEIDYAKTLVVYPNGLVDMRDQVISNVGQISPKLPKWMMSPQENGNVLGFTPAWVLAYTKPGASGQIAYNINTKMKKPLNLIDFEADRYELDHTLSIHWDPIAKKWVPKPAETTFDAEGFSLPLNYIGTVDYATTLPFVDINMCSIDYINALGGVDGPISVFSHGKTLIFEKQQDFVNPDWAKYSGPLSDELAWTDYDYPYDYARFGDYLYDEAYIVPGQIAHGKNPMIPNERMGIWKINILSGNIVQLELVKNTTTYDYVEITNGRRYNGQYLYVPSTQSGDNLYIQWEPIPKFTKTPTIFDWGSMKFIAPVDEYCPDDRFNQYLLYAKRNILTPIGE